MPRLSIAIAALGLTFFATGCGQLPAGGPASAEILKETQDNATSEFALYQVSRAFLPSVQQWPRTGKQEKLNWLAASQGPRTQIIQPGDQLALQIWDSNDNSLLTSSEQKVVQLQGMRVSGNGTVFMPYVGDINVNGLSPTQARAKLQAALEAIVPSAQVQLEMIEGRNNSVDLVSGVANPGTYPMPDRNYSVLGLISAGGGIGTELNNPQIRLVRGGQIYGTSIAALLDDPQKDTRLRGGDRVFVEDDSRYFLSFGATGQEALHAFTKDQISAMDALSISGGFQDTRADPEGLLILREYQPADIAPGQRGPRQERVIFTLDLTSADGLFSARNFQVNPGDLVIATESPINDTRTIVSLIGSAFGIINSAGL